jgi:hypothetical protein
MHIPIWSKKKSQTSQQIEGQCPEKRECLTFQQQMATSCAPTDTFLKPNLLGLPVTFEDAQTKSVCLFLVNNHVINSSQQQERLIEKLFSVNGKSPILYSKLVEHLFPDLRNKQNLVYHNYTYVNVYCSLKTQCRQLPQIGTLQSKSGNLQKLL